MKILLLLAIALLLFPGAECCTTAVISGKYTKDGRPLIWKLRDTESFKNKMMHFSDGKYNYVGLVNSKDIEGKQVWGGSNTAGFSIMNSASFNVNIDDTTSFKDQEGFFMKLALQECATLKDFESLLKEQTKPMGLAAHFGVMDAKGGVAFYEVNNYTYTKFDANDPAIAPNGYIIRTNYSFTGQKDTGYGFIRYQTAQDIFYEADAMGQLNHETIIQDFSRCFKHPILNKDYKKEYITIPPGEHFVNSGDFITRHGSSSAILIQGILPDEPAMLSTVWTTVGFPNTCITLPVWPLTEDALPKVLTASSNGNAPLNEWSLQLKAQCYPIQRSSGYKYLQISKLINSEQSGIVQRLEKAEKIIFEKTQEQLSLWRKSKPDANEINLFYNWLDSYVIDTYKNKFGVKTEN